jgi:Protein of unknown function (DUF2905)
MARFLITHGVVSLAAGLLWPYLSRVGLARLPGDFVIERDSMTFYFPLTTCLLLSVLGFLPARPGAPIPEVHFHLRQVTGPPLNQLRVRSELPDCIMIACSRASGRPIAGDASEPCGALADKGATAESLIFCAAWLRKMEW